MQKYRNCEVRVRAHIMSMRQVRALHMLVALVFAAVTLGACQVRAAGLLSPVDGSLPKLQIKSHDTKVLIQDGYGITVIDQVFHNPNTMDLEAIYSFPIPEKAAVSEFTYWIDGQPVTGEVLEKKQAREVYEDQKSQGAEAGLAEQDSYKTFDISVTPVRARSDVRIRFSYIQPTHIDTSVGRFAYPLQEGGVDTARLSFWTAEEAVTEKFVFDWTLRSAVPVEAVRLPAHPNAQITRRSDYEWNVRLESIGRPHMATVHEQDVAGFIPVSAPQAEEQAIAAEIARLDQDVVVYWRLQAGLPGSVDLVTHKPDAAKPGTFMLTITPGDDLRPITEGSDFVFVLDKSGSMNGAKIASLKHGVELALKRMRPTDRFRIIAFDERASEIMGKFLPATPENIKRAKVALDRLQAGGSTNLYHGLELGTAYLDADRSSMIIMVTDGVANVGITQQKKFLQLVDKKDVRLHTFIMGNSANRPLLSAITRRSNGSSTTISTSDDIVGAVLAVSSRLTHEAMHDVALSIDGISTQQLTPQQIGSLYRGEQLQIFGRYTDGGPAKLHLTAKRSGEKIAYETRVDFPKLASANPEIERLWAFSSIERMLQDMDDFGEQADMKQAVTDMAIEYSLVTPYTSMVVLREEVFNAMGIERHNRDRLAKEQQAQQTRIASAVPQTRVDAAQPMFTNRPRANHTANRASGGSGNVGFIGLLIAALLWTRRKDV